MWQIRESDWRQNEHPPECCRHECLVTCIPGKLKPSNNGGETTHHCFLEVSSSRSGCHSLTEGLNPRKAIVGVFVASTRDFCSWHDCRFGFLYRLSKPSFVCSHTNVAGRNPFLTTEETLVSDDSPVNANKPYGFNHGFVWCEKRISHHPHWGLTKSGFHKLQSSSGSAGSILRMGQT